MEQLIKASNIVVEYANREVLHIEELAIYDYDRIGLVGNNGAGKSTLLRVLNGELDLPACKLIKTGTFGYIPQMEEVHPQQEIDYALMARLGVGDLEKPQMSGGEKTRLKVASVLSANVHGIFADEPTCHLDQDGIDFLIGQLRGFQGALLIVSHDRYFLDETVNKIWELQNGTITEYLGNYSDYLSQKNEERQQQSVQYEQYIAEKNRLERAAGEKRKQASKVDKKTRASARKKKTESSGRLGHQKTIGSKQKTLYNAAKSMEHRIETMSAVEAPQKERSIHFRQSQALSLHNPYPVVGSDIDKRVGDKVLFKHASFSIPLGSKVAFTGANGVGKTTLLEMILNRSPGITVSSKAEIGYFTQNGYHFESDQKVLAFLQENSDYHQSEIRSLLASMGLSQGDIYKKISVLSGGELIKLSLAFLLLGRYNILLMDEPSNFLDLPAVEALEALMMDYKGTILFVSHDKRLLENVADQIYVIKDQAIYIEKSIN